MDPMTEFTLHASTQRPILALGAESAGNFAVYAKGKLYFSEDFGDLLDDRNWSCFQNKVRFFLKKHRLRPDAILTDLHPLYRTTVWGKDLSKKYKARHITIQHHLAHIFSAIGERMMISEKHEAPASSIGIALDGTGYGPDSHVWGGEIFEVITQKTKVRSVLRIGHLEDQTMIGGDLAVREPARMLMAILAKSWIMGHGSWDITGKEFIYRHVKKFYTRKQFELLHSQLQQNFNCQETSSTGRVLDAASIMLGFCGNERKYKHEPTILLEQSSTNPYSGLKPNIKRMTDKRLRVTSYELLTTPLFEYLVRNLYRDKKRLAATAQLYIAQGLYGIIKKCHPELPPASICEVFRAGVSGSKRKIPDQSQNDIFLAGGIANNKIISDYLISKGAIVNQKIPRGDAGISFGQIFYHLTNPRN